MNKIKEQLKNEDGSSLMIAIVILLICMVLGGIVISAASVNMTRLERSRRGAAGICHSRIHRAFYSAT